MNLGNSKTVWYSAGLQFECLQCGRCCAGPEMGYIWVSRPEIRLIADYLKMPVKELKQKFLRRVGFRMTIVEDPHTRDCVFLRETNQGRCCAIYDVRPAQCRNWPFWPVNLASSDAWNSTGTKCPGINKGRLYIHEEIQDKTKNKKWPALRPVRRSVSEVGSPSGAEDGDGENDLIIARVSEIYNWLDQQLAKKGIAGQCAACGECCDFERYDHRLYVTTPEIIYFVGKLDEGNIKQMTSGRCCYQVNGKCSVHTHRFSGCRIFCCKGDAAFQSELTEEAIKKFKALCAELQIPYRYVELPAALKSVVTAENAE
ncbi:MAG: YkgJ family cysteine cluster protein [Sedimentisphaerales bacterium]|jgi:Fe-S-cluster containining protein